MRITLTVVLAGVLAPPFAWGQKLELKLDHLKAKAAESAEVDLNGSALELALKSGLHNLVKPAKELNTEQIKQALVGLKGVYVRNFEFAKTGEYSDADVESVLKQVRDDSAWARLIRVKEKEELVEIYLMSKGDQVGGLLVLVAEAQGVDRGQHRGLNSARPTEGAGQLDASLRPQEPARQADDAVIPSTGRQGAARWVPRRAATLYNQHLLSCKRLPRRVPWPSWQASILAP